MPGNPRCTLYIGSLDERVSERVLYDILIQAGRVVDLFIPKDKETERPKGFAFAEYETEEIAEYAVKLFSGVVTLYNRPLKFGISGQDKAPQSQTTPINSTSNTPHRLRPRIVSTNNMDISQHSTRISLSSRSSAFPDNYSQEPPPPGVTYHSNEHGLHSNSNDYRYSRRAFGTALDGINSTRSRSYDTRIEGRFCATIKFRERVKRFLQHEENGDCFPLSNWVSKAEWLRLVCKVSSPLSFFSLFFLDCCKSL